MTSIQYAQLIFLTVLTLVGAVRSRSSAGTLNQVGLYFARDAHEFKQTLQGLEPKLIASLYWDGLFLTGYCLLFLSIGAFQLHQGGWGFITMLFGVGAAILDQFENRALIQLSAQNTTQTGIDGRLLRQMQTLCVTKFLCSSVATASSALFFAGQDGWKLALMLVLIVGAAGLMAGCLTFVIGRILHADWNNVSGRVVQLGLKIASLGLAASGLEYVREWINPASRPF